MAGKQDMLDKDYAPMTCISHDSHSTVLSSYDLKPSNYYLSKQQCYNCFDKSPIGVIYHQLL